MSTYASIQLNNLSKPLCVVVSSDGDPETMLHLLADFFENDGPEFSFSKLEERYYLDYPESCRQYVAISESSNLNSEYCYVVDDKGCLKIDYNFESQSFKHNPYSYVKKIIENSKHETRTSIHKSLAKLHDYGVAMDEGVARCY